MKTGGQRHRAGKGDKLLSSLCPVITDIVVSGLGVSMGVFAARNSSGCCFDLLYVYHVYVSYKLNID